MTTLPYDYARCKVTDQPECQDCRSQVQQAAILWTCRQFWSHPRDFGTLMEMVQAAIRGE